MLRQGIKKIIKESMTDIVVVGEASNGTEALELMRSVETDMVLLDISMPRLRGIEVAAEMRVQYPLVKILILSMHKNIGFVRQAMAAGAKGYLLKEDTDSELFAAIRAVRQGRVYFSSLLTSVLTADWAKGGTGGREMWEDVLTTREREILKLVAEGKSSREIAVILHISANTVKNHRANLMRKLNLGSVADLTRYAVDMGYLLEHL